MPTLVMTINPTQFTNITVIILVITVIQVNVVIKLLQLQLLSCNLGECVSPDTNVSCMTTMTVRESLGNHRYHVSINKLCVEIIDHNDIKLKESMVEIYNIRPKLDHLLDNTKIMNQAQNKLGLPIFEALHIHNRCQVNSS